MRESRPIPLATWVTSAPTRSQILATSLIKLIFVAKKALAAYLIISAELRSVTTTGTAGREVSSENLRSTMGV